MNNTFLLEQSILGWLLLNIEYFKNISEYLKADYFSDNLHKKIFQILVNNILENNIKDIKSISFLIEEEAKFLKLEKGYIPVLIQEGVSVIDIKSLCKTLKDMYKKREILNFSKEIERDINSKSSNELLEELEKKIQNINEDIEEEKFQSTSLAEICAKRILDIKNNTSDTTKNIIKTKIMDFDREFNGLSKKNLTILAGRSAMGKALTMDTKILTPNGWKLNKDIKIDDKVIGSNGKTIRVLGVFPQGITHNFKITFSDNRSINCSEDHLWNVFVDKKEVTLSAKEINELIKKHKKISVHKFSNLNFINTQYSTFISNLYKKCMINRSFFVKYQSHNSYIIQTKDEILANVIQQKFWFFGQNCIKEKKDNYFILTTNDDDLFIKSIKKIEDSETQCLYVNSEDHLFVVDNYIVTHNTTLALQIAINVARQDKNVLFFSQEMCASEQADKIMSNFAKINSTKIKTNELTEEEIERLKKEVEEKSSIPLFINEKTYIDTNFIKSSINNFKKKYKKNIDLVIVDHLQIMADKNNSQNRVGELDKISMECKNIARDYNCAFLLLSQLSRKADDRDNHLPVITDLRESGGIEQNADCVFAIYREAYYFENKLNEAGTNFEDIDELQRKYNIIKNQANIICLKNRNGKTGNLLLYFEPEFSLFQDIKGKDLEKAYQNA